MERDENALWDEIVAHYDETAGVEDDTVIDPFIDVALPEDDDPEAGLPRADPHDPHTVDLSGVDLPELDPPDVVFPDEQPQAYVVPPPEPEPEEPPELRAWGDEGRYVPPPPEPIPLPEKNRLIGWLGVFGAPLIALIALVLHHPFRGLLALLLVAWFVGGFIYLVRTMPDEPRDPWDDGSRI
ncbi:hypothetical protein [Nocardioides jensenii]|uniref:hypothetical protein n=1 Tax=Nocardioides jensenii TaxID=1843 RepID=UPI000837A5A5|nr:hypothetical protein [Nocardioides jensenii]